MLSARLQPVEEVYAPGGRIVAMRPLLDLLDLLWPRDCLGCGRRLDSCLRFDGAEHRSGSWRSFREAAAQAPPLGLCPSCEVRLVAVDPRAACRTCARPMAPMEPMAPMTELAEGTTPVRCGACLADPPPFDRLIARWRYEPPLRAVVEAFKFGRLDFLGRHFARELASTLVGLETAGGWQVPELVVPVPLPWPRRFARGFNQTELVATPLARLLDRPTSRALRRHSLAPRQTGRDRRTRRLAARFRVGDRAAIAGRSILLLDDVFTTGATARAASLALRRAGAARIEVAVIAWTPPPGG